MTTAYNSLTTKKAKIEFIRQNLATNDRWIFKALVRIYDHQTVNEQRTIATTEHNGVGFNGMDGVVMTSIAQQFIKRGGRDALSYVNFTPEAYLSPKQIDLVKKKIQKYATQLYNIAESK